MAVRMPVVVAMSVTVAVRMGGKIHSKMLYYNITEVHRGRRLYGLPIAMAIAAARNGIGRDTAARNQTKRAGMNGISNRSRR